MNYRFVTEGVDPEKIRARVMELERAGKPAGVIRRIIVEEFRLRTMTGSVRRIGIELAHNGGGEKPGGKAAERRRRQMAQGQAPRRCQCGTELPKGRTAEMCDPCLMQKWG